jgi:serine/threonine protein kinase
LFAAGLQSFMREAQLLAGFDHPSLVKVHRFWKANGTAYMVMPHYPGRTLKEVQRATGPQRDEQSLRRLLHPLLCALEVLHEARVFHRDISPDNIIVLPDDKPVLLDFGSARHVLSDRTQALTAIFKPSFAAIEQYGDVPGLKQGAWTDLYALAGVMHFMITGSPPVPAALRAVNDAQPRLAASVGKGGLSMSLLHAIDWALAVRPDQRPQSVQAFREVLDGLAPAPEHRIEAPPASAPGLPTAAASASPAARLPSRLPNRRLMQRALAWSPSARACAWQSGLGTSRCKPAQRARCRPCRLAPPLLPPSPSSAAPARPRRPCRRRVSLRSQRRSPTTPPRRRAGPPSRRHRVPRLGLQPR